MSGRARALALVLLALQAGPDRASAQGATVDIAADRLIGSRTAEGVVVDLVGNVVLRRGTTVVRSDRGRWIKARQMVTLTGAVQAVDGTLRLTAEQAEYHENTDLILVLGDVHVTDRDLDARSQFGSYDTKARRAEMWGRVEGIDRGRRLKADRVAYTRDNQLAEAEGNVWATDSSGTLVLTGARMTYDRVAQQARAFGSPRITRSEGGRKTILTGDTLTLDTERRIARAEGNVHIVRDTLQARARHAIYWDREDRGLLTGEPKAEDNEVAATGDTIEVFTRHDELDRASVRGAARIDFVSVAPGARGERDRLTATRMELFFGGDRIDSLHAVGAAENLYEGVPRERKLAERNLSRGERVAVYFGPERIERAVLTGKPSGEYRFEIDAADSARVPQETVVYEGDRIDYYVPEKRIRITQAARLRYQNLALEAGRVDFDSEKQTLVARDKPLLKDGSEELSGRTMVYDLEDRKGTVYHAATRYDRGYYSGKAIQRVGDDILQVRGASYSTCDRPDPHWHIGSDKMKILLKDKIIARPVVFYIKQIPLFALPFYVLPIKPDRHSGVLFPQFQFGFSDRNGRFVRNVGYYWAPNDFMDATLSGDYYEREPSWILRGEGRYRYLDRVLGAFDARYTGSEAFLGHREALLNLTHSQTLGTYTRLTAEGHFTSSRDFTRDPRTGDPLANRLDRFLISTVALNHRLPWGSLNLFLSRRQDLDTDPVASPLPRLVEDVPVASFVAFQRALGRVTTAQRPGFLPFLSSLYYNFNVRAANHRETRTVLRADFDTTVVAPGDTLVSRGTRDSVSTTRAALGQGSLSDNRRILGFLNVSPSFGSTQVLYEKDSQGRSWQPAAVYNLGFGASTTFYGTFHPRLGPLTGFRHVLFPQISYYYQPDFPGLTYRDTSGVLRNRFPPVAGISLSGFRQSLLNYSLQQRIQMKLKKGDETIQLPNLITVTSGSSYDFLWRRLGLASPWRPLSTTIRIQPPGYFTVSGNLNHSFDHKPYLRSYSFFADLRLSGSSHPSPVADLPLEGNEALARGDAIPTGPWSLSLSYSYTAGRNSFGNWEPNQTGNAYLTFSPTRNWHFDYYNTVDIDRRQIVAQEYSVVRDLHCWRARFVRRFTEAADAEYYFRISIIDRPEVYVERGSRGLGSYAGY